MGDCGNGEVDVREVGGGANWGEEERGVRACSSSSFNLLVRSNCSNCFVKSAALKSNSSSRMRGRGLFAMTVEDVCRNSQGREEREDEERERRRGQVASRREFGIMGS